MGLFWGDDGSWRASQANYTLSLLVKNLGSDRKQWKTKKTPMGKDGAVDSGDEFHDEDGDVETSRPSERPRGSWEGAGQT